MIQIENVQTSGWEAAIRGMRNPMNSWGKSDSGFCDTGVFCEECEDKQLGRCAGGYMVGDADFGLMCKLAAAGPNHGKFLRMITVTADITGPLYWWKEFDTYKVGTVANSCSTMHKIHAKEFTLEDFSYEHLLNGPLKKLIGVIDELNFWRDVYLKGLSANNGDFAIRAFEPKDKEAWWQMIQLLPSSYNQRRTIQMNYAVLRNIYEARSTHKLDEWRSFCRWAEGLPCAKGLIFQEGAAVQAV